MRARYWLLGPLLVVGGGIATFVGARWSYRSVTNRAPVTISCAEFADHPPAADWVRLTDCEPMLENFASQTFETKYDGQSSSTPKQPAAVFLPLRAPATSRRAQIVLFADSGPLVQLADATGGEQAAEQLFSQPVEGMIEGRLDRSERSRKEIRGTGLNVASEFVIVDYNAKPRPLPLGLGMFALGLGALGFVGHKVRRRRRPVALARATLVSS
ncbi:MAG TPA: hypothetical protein VGM90_25650 [Kofleriaceae bacterium]|jgi:hypothetical protein